MVKGSNQQSFLPEALQEALSSCRPKLWISGPFLKLLESPQAHAIEGAAQPRPLSASPSPAPLEPPCYGLSPREELPPAAPPHILATDTRKSLICPRTLGLTTPAVLVHPASLLPTNVWVDTCEFRQYCPAPSLLLSLAFLI